MRRSISKPLGTRQHELLTNANWQIRCLVVASYQLIFDSISWENCQIYHINFLHNYVIIIYCCILFLHKVVIIIQVYYENLWGLRNLKSATYLDRHKRKRKKRKV